MLDMVPFLVVAVLCVAPAVGAMAVIACGFRAIVVRPPQADTRQARIDPGYMVRRVLDC